MCSARAANAGAFLGLILLVCCWLPASSLWAGEARLAERGDPDRVVIETNDASVDEILAVLAKHFEFAVERNGPPSQGVRFSGRLQGSLDEVLERILRHEGHMIVRSAEARAGVGRIVFLEAKGRPPAPTLAGPIAAIKAKMESRETEGK